MDSDIGEIRPEARFHPLADSGLQGRAAAPAHDLLHRRLLLRVPVEELRDAGVPGRALEAHDCGLAERVGPAGRRRSGRERRCRVLVLGPTPGPTGLRFPVVLVAMHARVLPQGRSVI